MTKGELHRTMRHVRRLIDSRKKKEALWSSLIASLALIAKEAAGVVADINAKRPTSGATRNPALLVYTVVSEVEAEEIILAMVAVGYIAADERHRFKSDDAFFATAGRRFHMLARSNFTGFLNRTSGKRHLTVREPKVDAVREVGRRMMSAFAPIGIRLHELERRREREAAEVRSAPLATLADDLH